MDIRGVYRFSSLLKQNKKAKIYAVFCFAEKDFFFYIYDVITWEIFYKRSSNYYFHGHLKPLQPAHRAPQGNSHRKPSV